MPRASSVARWLHVDPPRTRTRPLPGLGMGANSNAGRAFVLGILRGGNFLIREAFHQKRAAPRRASLPRLPARSGLLPDLVRNARSGKHDARNAGNDRADKRRRARRCPRCRVRRPRGSADAQYEDDSSHERSRDINLARHPPAGKRAHRCRSDNPAREHAPGARFQQHPTKARLRLCTDSRARKHGRRHCARVGTGVASRRYRT